MILPNNSTWVFFGDSVTDCNRQEAGEGLFEAIGNGYVADIQSLLTICYPDYNIRTINKGISGNTSADLVMRFDDDVLPYHPQILSIMIGINDVWRQFDSRLITEQAVSLEEYQKNMELLIARAKPFAEKLILITPYYMEPNKQDSMRARMDEYSDVVENLAKQHDAIFVNLQSAWDKLFTQMHSSAIAWDRIHPNSQGAMYIAKTILDAVGFDWNRNW